MENTERIGCGPTDHDYQVITTGSDYSCSVLRWCRKCGKSYKMYRDDEHWIEVIDPLRKYKEVK